MNHVELFAGCGGLTLGLEAEDFNLLFANELSPMASETFAFNILKTNLDKDSMSPNDRVYWLRSEYERDQLRKRLRERPDDERGLVNSYCDLDTLGDYRTGLRASLIVGSIRDLNDRLESDSVLEAELVGGLGDGGVDLVSGGPPCQSFSMAGLRQHQNVRNQLPWEFAKLVGRLRPKMVMLENVTGILRAFRIEGEPNPHYAWFEVAKAFAVEGYMPVCLHVNAKYVGAAQNRPRFIMLAFEQEVAEKIVVAVTEEVDKGREVSSVKELFDESSAFLEKVGAGKEPVIGDLIVRDVEKYFGPEINSIYRSELFRDLVINPLAEKMGKELVSVEDAIDDLRASSVIPSQYVEYINKEAFANRPILEQENHDFRNHKRKGRPSVVESRFRLYQIISQLKSPRGEKEVSNYLRTQNLSGLSNETLEEMMGKRFLFPDGSRDFCENKAELIAFLDQLSTKKQTQKALIRDKPAPAALSIPDDACHYNGRTLRTLTVREMARIQSFPDWFVFRSKITTGGQMRKFEVPQYTQVGNAVPPLLGRALGKICKKLLMLTERD